MSRSALSLTVARVWPVAEAVAAFELRDPHGGALPPFTAGAHVDVHLEGGLVRQYSLVNDETERDRYVIAVQRLEGGRGGSVALHREAREGRSLAVAAPRNTFPLAACDAPVLLLAGGIGITPLLAMARALDRGGQPFALHYSAADRGRAAFAEELLAGPFRDAVQLYETRAQTPRRLDLHRLAREAPAGTRVYACGPDGLMRDAVAAFAARPDIEVRTEHFAGAAAASADTEAFSLVLARQGRALDVPGGCSILEALRRDGRDPEASCEQGVCGTCMVDVVSGEVDHRDYVLSPSERSAGGRMLICVSRGRPGGTLVLDL